VMTRLGSGVKCNGRRVTAMAMVESRPVGTSTDW
jgi:hypothetical protein